jgi:hypothetical protein
MTTGMGTMMKQGQDNNGKDQEEGGKDEGRQCQDQEGLCNNNVDEPYHDQGKARHPGQPEHPTTASHCLWGGQ